MFRRYQKCTNHDYEIEKIFSTGNYELMPVSKKNRLYYILKETFKSEDKYVA
tara:strand:- start:1083 stop:1238 length:156 start_codon:yes stop_codon:yes gene_type:complete